MKWECQKSYFLFLNLTFSGQAYSLRRYAFHNPGIVHNKNSAFHRFQCSSRERKRSFIHIMYFAFLLNCYFYVYLSPCPRDAGVIWRRRFRSENPSNVFDHNTHEEIETERNNNHSYHDVIVFEKSAFSKCFPSQQKQKPSVFKFLRFEERFRIEAPFRDGWVWTVGLTVEIKLRFHGVLVWAVGLTVEIKLRFRDGLVRTVGSNLRNKAPLSNSFGGV